MIEALARVQHAWANRVAARFDPPELGHALDVLDRLVAATADGARRSQASRHHPSPVAVADRVSMKPIHSDRRGAMR